MPRTVAATWIDEMLDHQVGLSPWHGESEGQGPGGLSPRRGLIYCSAKVERFRFIVVTVL